MKQDALLLNPRLQSGTALVEFAIALPLLLLLMLAVAELGRCLYQYNSLNKQVRNAVRYVSANARVGSTGVIDISDEVRSIAKHLTVFGSLSNDQELLPGLSIDDVIVEETTPEYVLVTVDYDYQPMISYALPTFGLGDDLSLGLTLKASVVMRAI